MNVDNVQKPAAPPANGAAPAAAASKKTKRVSLDNVRAGKIDSPFRALLYGTEKTGKSTFAAGAPSPIWLGSESGTEHLDIKRLPEPETWNEALEGLHDVGTRGMELGFRTLVVDPLGWFQPMAIFDFTGDPKANLATWGGGRGAGYQELTSRWRIFTGLLNRAWKSGLNVILIAHSEVKTFNNPTGPDYDRYQLELDKRAAAMLKQWVDHILFCKQETFTKVDANKKVKAYGSSATMLYTQCSPAFDAGNRACLPPVMPLSWGAFAEALVSGKTQAEALRAQIEEGLVELADPAVALKVREYLANPLVDLAEIANAVAAKLGAKRQVEAEQSSGAPAPQEETNETKEG